MKKYIYLIPVFIIALYTVCEFVSSRKASSNLIHSSGDSFFQYDNVSLEDSLLISYLTHCKCSHDIETLLPLDDTLLENINVIDTVPDNIYSSIIVFNSANLCSMSANRKERSLPLFCGMVKISDSYESFLFMLESNKYIEKRELFLINIKNDIVTSVSEIYNYMAGMGDVVFSQTIAENNNFFYHLKTSIAGDVGYEDETEDYSTQRDSIFFEFDKNGQIILKK